MFNTIASICSILGLVVAFWQIWEVKKKLKSTQNALEELREVFIDQKIDVLLRTISRQQEELVRVISNLAKKGRSPQKAQEEIQNIILELNKCNNELPEKHKDISNGLENAIGELQKTLLIEISGEKTQRDYLLDADGYLKGCIHGLKGAVDLSLDQTVGVIARANK